MQLFQARAWYRGYTVSMMQVASIGQTATHCGSSKYPMHSVHFFGLMTKAKSFAEIATFGHSASHAAQDVQFSATIV
jgi:hypothetical protein